VALPDGLTVVSTHVSWGEKRGEQLRVLRAGVEALGACVVGGDFNVDRGVVEAALGVPCAPLPEASLPTRDDEKGRALWIDHLLAFGGPWLEGARVEAHGEESDHRPVTAQLARGT
jgi:endonuclease/exonuclease/phosphatase family metal-dependent hydrolase